MVIAISAIAIHPVNDPNNSSKASKHQGNTSKLMMADKLLIAREFQTIAPNIAPLRNIEADAEVILLPKS